MDIIAWERLLNRVTNDERKPMARTRQTVVRCDNCDAWLGTTTDATTLSGVIIQPMTIHDASGAWGTGTIELCHACAETTGLRAVIDTLSGIEDHHDRG